MTVQDEYPDGRHFFHLRMDLEFRCNRSIAAHGFRLPNRFRDPTGNLETEQRFGGWRLFNNLRR